MKLEHYPVEKFEKDILSILKKHCELKGYRVFLFGSRVDGSGTERSDIDIGLEGPWPIPLNVLRKIKEELDKIPILYQIDVVDFQDVSNDFRENALKVIEPIGVIT